MVFHLPKNIVKSLVMSSAGYLSRFYSLYTPDYLCMMKSKIPLYPMVLIQIKGYNYPTLENFQRLIHNHATTLDVDIENSYAMPSKSIKVERLINIQKGLKIEYQLELYERNVLISKISSLRLPIFIRLIESTLPEGVTLKIQQWNSSIGNLRFIPDKDLLDLKGELENMQKK